MQKRYETVMLYIIGISERLKELFMKAFPYAAVVFGLLFTLGLAGGADRNTLTCSDIPTIVIIAMAFTILTLLYVVAVLKDKLSNR